MLKMSKKGVKTADLLIGRNGREFRDYVLSWLKIQNSV